MLCRACVSASPYFMQGDAEMNSAGQTFYKINIFLHRSNIKIL